MSDDPRWDPEMRAARLVIEERAAKFPPVEVVDPMEPHRRINDALALPWTRGGPAPPVSRDIWINARGRRVMCRLHRPKAEGVLPVLVWFHGGGWVWLNVDTHDRLMRELTMAAGVATVSVDYSLSPEAKFPHAVLECAAVVRGLVDQAAEWGLDPSRIVLGGDSAGGNLAFTTALALAEPATVGPELAGLLAMYPVIEPDFGTPSYREFATGFGLTAERMRAFWQLYLRDDADRANPLAIPSRGGLAGLPPTFVQLAELDVLRSEGQAFAQRLADAGVTCEVKVYRGMLHGFVLLTAAVAMARTAVNDAAAWLIRVTGA
jgi:acetyl esterase